MSKKNIFLIISLISIYNSISSCPTCIGLPLYHERPFFERKSFLAAVQQPAPQKQQNKTQQPTTAKSTQEKTTQ